MTPEITIAVVMVVLNEERFLDLSLTRIRDYADEILIAEGATELAVELGWAEAGGASTDRTREIIDAWSRRSENKIGYAVFAYGPWADKAAMYNALLARVGPEISHIHLVSPDEIYERADLVRIRELLRDDPDRILAFRCRHYGPGGIEFHGGDGGVLDHYYHRVFPWKAGLRFATGAIDRLGGGIPVREVDEVKIQHYGHIDPAYSARKAVYYGLREARRRK